MPPGLAILVALSAACGTTRDTTLATPSSRPPASSAPAVVAASASSLEVAGCPPITGDEPRVRFGAEDMVALCRDLVIEPAIAPDVRQRIARDYAAARDDVVRGLGPLRAEPPLAVFCATDPCREWFGGPPKRSWTLSPGQQLPGASYKNGARLAILVFRVDDRARGVIAHESVHVEVSHRLGQGRVPLWFHEGLAAIVGGEPRCTGHEERGVDDLRRLDLNAAWADYTNTRGTIGGTYCQARAEVDAWMRRGPEGRVVDLITKVHDGASFSDVYGAMLTQPMGPIPTVLVSPAPSLGDGNKPFSLALWIKPVEKGGVLAHVSSTPVGTGWCLPFLGYDSDKHLVAQVFHGDSADLASFAVAVDPRPRPDGKWTHVAMTWAPGSPGRLYVDGAPAAEVKAPRYNAPGAGPPIYVAWGSLNVGGASCWRGAIRGGTFRGKVADPRIYASELTATEVAALARLAP